MTFSESQGHSAGPTRRQVVLGMAALAAGGALKGVAANVPASTGPAGAGLIVHEWGVAIRHVTASGTVLAAPVELAADLPTFVEQHKSAKNLVPQGWDKPVIWFSGNVPDGTMVRVAVKADQGFGTAAFPKAELLTRRFSHTDRRAMMVSLLTELAGFQWQGTLTRAPAGVVPRVDKKHWWQIARDAGGLYFNCGGDAERFIFYEATAFQEPPIAAKVSVDAVTIRNDYDGPSGQVLVLINVGSKHYMRVVDSIGGKAEVKLGRGEVMGEAWSEENVISTCAAQWKSFGMTGAEGEAITAVWRDDLLKAGRFLLISRMPAKLYEAMFRLTIEPVPKEVVRVGMLFDALEGQVDASAWLPGSQDGLAQAARDLASSDWSVREQAAHTLAGAGERARGLLESLTKSADPEVSARAAELLKGITPEVETLTREGTDKETGVVIRAAK